jgi:hypothetical protein
MDVAYRVYVGLLVAPVSRNKECNDFIRAIVK